MRLVDGQTDTEGYIEYHINSQWGYVCHDKWDRPDAIVACKQLGFTDETRIQLLDGTSSVNGNIVASGVECTGLESILLECSMSSEPFGVTCQSNKKAGVNCSKFKLHI